MIPGGCGSNNDGSPATAASMDLPPAPKPGYPPTRTGMRGSHPGSYEVAHAFARDGMQFDDATDLEEEYDLIVVGGGISGLAAAYQYRKKFGADARILILDNHDDFGGHAKRNEFHQGGTMRLSWGGTMNMEHLSFDDEVNAFLNELGVDPESLSEKLEFTYGGDRPSIWFDAETFGKNVLVPHFSIHGFNIFTSNKIDDFPMSESARTALKKFYQKPRDITADMTEEQIDQLLYKTSYTDFLSQHAELPEEAVELFIKATDGYWGVPTHSLSTAEALGAWLPGAQILGKAARRAMGNEVSEAVAMFPDGNASIARLLVASLIPAVAADVTAKNVALAKFDYAQLDQPQSKIRVRLSSTVVRAQNQNGRVAVTYVRGSQVQRVKAKHCVLACFHAIIPHLCPETPEPQKQAQRNQVKHPMLVTNVLLRNGKAFDELGISGAYCPGRMHAKMYVIEGVDTGGYQQGDNPDEPVTVMLWGMTAPPNRGLSIHEQLREARQALLETPFESFEREVRTVLDGMLGPTGFRAADDILAITVNRWPHGYSYGYLDLWDPKYKPGEAPHEIARRPIGNISIANSDAAASAYTQAAISEALRAVGELS